MYVLDFAYPREWMLEMDKVAYRLKVLDHHISAATDLKGLSFAHIDTSRSGASLTWDMLVGGPRPLLVDFVESVDLWKERFVWAPQALERLALEPRTFGVWDELAQWDLRQWEAFAEEGRPLYSERARSREWYFDARHAVTLRGVSGLASCAPADFSSDLGHLLAKDSGTFGMTYQLQDGILRVSLRSIAPFSVEALARHYGGGGHPQAAGFGMRAADATRRAPELLPLIAAAAR